MQGRRPLVWNSLGAPCTGPVWAGHAWCAASFLSRDRLLYRGRGNGAGVCPTLLILGGLGDEVLRPGCWRTGTHGHTARQPPEHQLPTLAPGPGHQLPCRAAAPPSTSSPNPEHQLLPYPEHQLPYASPLRTSSSSVPAPQAPAPTRQPSHRSVPVPTSQGRKEGPPGLAFLCCAHAQGW